MSSGVYTRGASIGPEGSSFAPQRYGSQRAPVGGPLGGVALGSMIGESITEARRPIVYATLIILLGASPVLFVAGRSGTFLAPLAVAYCLAIVVSLIVERYGFEALRGMVRAFADGVDVDGDQSRDQQCLQPAAHN